MLTAKGLRKRYKQREVVADFGLTLQPGEVVGLLGPNGAGKTTCFYMIVGLVAADAGTIELDGQDITAQPMYQRAKLGVGYLPQEPSVFRKLTVADNLRLVLELREDLDSAGRERELNSLLDELRSEIRPDSIQINDHIAVIAVVGRKMAFRVGTSGKIFAALGKAGINIRMISQGPDELNIIVGVNNDDFESCVRVLYNSFVK